MAQVDRQPYGYSAEPKAVSARRKFRDPYEEDEKLSSNIMWDRRVVRGNTYAVQVLPANAQADPVALQKDRDARKRRRLKQQRDEQERLMQRSPEPVEGRKHMDIQTELYLEELTDVVPEVDVDTQTDPFMDRPPSPLFVPQKSGLDAETQIGEGELFNFDYEVEGILDVMVGKTLEQAMMEVLEEEELAAMRAHQEEFDHIRNAELAETQRLEAEEERRIEEKENRKKQEMARLDREREVAEKVAARAFAHSYLAGLQSTVFGNLAESGVFYDEVERNIETEFLPSLLQAGAAERLAHAAVSKTLVNDVMLHALRVAVVRHREHVAEQQRITEEQARLDEEERVRKEEEAKLLAEQEPAAGDDE